MDAPRPMTRKELLSIREALDKSQAELGHMVGVSQVTVCNWENGIHRIPRAAATLLRQFAAAAQAQPVSAA